MRLNGNTLNPGDMTVRITLQKRSVTTEDGGFKHPEWSDLAEVWSSWVNVHGNEVWAAQSNQAMQAATVLIRYRSDVNLQCAVQKGSQRYEIVSMDDLREKHEYIELKVKRMAAG